MNKVNLAIIVALIPIVAFLLFVAGKSGFLPYAPEGDNLSTIRIGNIPVHVSIADTAEERARGLSGTASLGENDGLLLSFGEHGAHGIWMKDMQFPIDIIWMAASSETSSSGGGEVFRIVDIKRNARPESFPEIFFPSQNALYVLEVNSGFVDTHNIRVGDPVRLPQ